MAGKGGGSWKVAYADFVTAMMAFFMVMWITAQNQDAKEAVSNYFQDPFAKAGEANGPASGLPGGGPAPSRKGDHGKRPGVKTVPSDPSSLGTTILFAPSSAELSEESQTHLRSLAPELSGIPQRIEIRGHASRAPLAANSGFADAWALSYARCQAAMAFLIAQGVEAERIRLSQAGAYQPATSAESAEEQRENERVEVFVLREFVAPASGVASQPGADRSEHEAAAGEGDKLHAHENDAHEHHQPQSHDRAAQRTPARAAAPRIVAAANQPGH